MDTTELRAQAGPQQRFLSSQAHVAIYGGAAGGGKSYGLLLEPLYDIDNPQFRAVLFRRTSPRLTAPGGLWDTSSQIYSLLGAKPNRSLLEWTFPSGATIKMAGMESESDRYNWQGSQIPLIEFDECQEFSESQFWFMLSRNRSMSGARCRIRCSVNPDADSWLRIFLAWWIDGASGFPIPERSGKLRWFVRIADDLHWADSAQELVQQFGTDVQPKSCTFISAKVTDNRILLERDPGYIANLRALPLVERSRLLLGNWNIRAAAGNYFRREWFSILDCVPKDAQIVGRVRYWDRAATEKRTGNDPDSSVGLLLSKDVRGIYYVEHVLKMYATPHAVEQAMLTCAAADGLQTTCAFAQDPGSAGVAEAQATARALDGYNVRFAPATGDKETRAKPVSAQSEAGNIKIVRGLWNDDFLRELEGFPIAVHDDQVDSLSGAHAVLSEQSSGAFTAESFKQSTVGTSTARLSMFRRPVFFPRRLQF